MQTGWQTIDRKTYYCIRRPADRLALEDGARYMGTDGGLQKGLVKVGSYQYYLGEDGIMAVSSWQEIDGGRYQFGKKGKAYTGTRTLDSVTYTFGADGRLQ